MPRPARGFTLVEMLVALAIMALLAVMSWRGLDAMLRARQVTADNHAVLQSLQGGLAQWQIDLDALVETPYVNPVEWDGRVLRVLRRSPAGYPEALQVVAWALGTVGDRPHLLRWQSRPLQGRADLLGAWADASAWGSNAVAEAQRQAGAGAQVLVIAPVQAWQLSYFRAGQWLAADSLMRAENNQASGQAGSAGSTANTSGQPSLGDLPEGLRLQWALSAPGPLQGLLQIDWFNPLAGVAR